MDVTKLPCPVCGGTDYEIGNASFGASLLFEKRTVSNFALGLFKALASPSNTYTNTSARHCLTCNNVQLFTGIVVKPKNKE